MDPRRPTKARQTGRWKRAVRFTFRAAINTSRIALLVGRCWQGFAARDRLSAAKRLAILALRTADSPMLVLGTSNQKKAEELIALVAPLNLAIKTLADFPAHGQVAETGSSFGENARLKATRHAQGLGQWVIGEDSGLMVDALDGAPGIYSARFAGEQATDEQNNRHLLEALRGTPPGRRTAHYVCHVALADPEGIAQAEYEAECHGRVRDAPAGTAGFGYDPLFEVVEYHRTFGQMGPYTKQLISHRSRALRALLPTMIALVHGGQLSIR